MARKDILPLLAGRDRRSIGYANEAAAAVAKESQLFPKLIAGMWSEDPVVRMRAADATEKVTRKTPALLYPYKKEMFGLLAEAAEKELRWHLAVMVPRLRLNAKERQRAATLLEIYLKDRSSIVKSFALQGLAELSMNDAGLRVQVVDLLGESLRNGTAAMKARSRKLLARLERG
jgi:hypothetical protein